MLTESSGSGSNSPRDLLPEVPHLPITPPTGQSHDRTFTPLSPTGSGSITPTAGFSSTSGVPSSVIYRFGSDGSGSEIESNSFDEGPLRQINDLSQPRACSCSKKKLKAALLAVGILGAAATGVLVYRELAGEKNVTKTALYLLLNGASEAAIAHPLLSACGGSIGRNRIYRHLSDFSYPILFTVTQFYLNLPPEYQAGARILFVWWFGLLMSKDLINSVGLTVSDFPTPFIPPDDGQELPMCGFKTRNHKAATVFLTAGMITAIVLSVFNLIFRDTVSESELDKTGLITAGLALLGGNFLGEALTRIGEHLREKAEQHHLSGLLSSSLPLRLRIARITKTFLTVLSPPAIAGLLAIPLRRNSIGDFFLKAFIGTVYGAEQFVLRKEFENRDSPVHIKSLQNISTRSSSGAITVAGRVKDWAKEHWISIGLIGALIIYMGVVGGDTPSSRIHGGIATLVTSAVAGFGVTDYIAHKFRPGQNARIVNEVAFRSLYAVSSFLFFYQVMTMSIDIYDTNLQNDSRSYYGLALLTWCLWGLAVGNNLATMRHRNVEVIATHPLTTQELAKTTFAVL